MALIIFSCRGCAWKPPAVRHPHYTKDKAKEMAAHQREAQERVAIKMAQERKGQREKKMHEAKELKDLEAMKTVEWADPDPLELALVK